MGLGDRGVERGKCRVEDCDCTEFISSTDSISYGYSGDPQPKTRMRILHNEFFKFYKSNYKKLLEFKW